MIAFLSSGISFFRFLRSYLLGALIIAIIAFLFGLFIVPNASKDFNEFSYKYLKGSKKSYDSQNIYRQISPNDYIYLKSYNINSNQGHKFSYEKFDGTKLKYKLMAENIRWIASDTIFRLNTYKKRFLLEDGDSIETGVKLDTLMSFEPKDLINVDDLAKAVAFAVKNKLPEHLYNVGTGTDITIKKLAETIQKIVGHQGKIIWDSSKPDGTPRKLLDVSKLNSLGWKARMDLEIGIEDTYKWYCKNQIDIKEVKLS